MQRTNTALEHKLRLDITEKDIYKTFCFSFKVNDNYYINIQKEVMDSILNMILLNGLIEMFLKANSKVNNFGYLIRQLIQLNLKIRGGVKMDKSMKGAYTFINSLWNSDNENNSQCTEGIQKPESLFHPKQGKPEKCNYGSKWAV